MTVIEVLLITNRVRLELGEGATQIPVRPMGYSFDRLLTFRGNFLSYIGSEIEGNEVGDPSVLIHTDHLIDWLLRAKGYRGCRGGLCTFSDPRDLRLP